MNPRFYIFTLLITIFSFAGCIPTRHLAEDEELLVSMKTKGLEHIEPMSIASLYQQQPNRMVLWSTPYLSLYYFGKRFYNPEKIDQRITKLANKRETRIKEAGTDTLKIRKIQNRFEQRIERQQNKKEEGNFFMQLGEPPSIYDSTLMEATMNQIEFYMDGRGYFNHESEYSKEERGKKVYITIQVKENTPYRYSHINYAIPDTAVLRVLQRTSVRSLIKTGDLYDDQVLTEERDRMYNSLRNNGFYEFAKAYIRFEVDTSFGGNTVRLDVIVDNPEDAPGHKLYTLENVYFKTDNDRFGRTRDTITYNNINFLSYNHKYSPRILDLKTNIAPGQPYSQIRTTITQRRLSELDVFQFNNITYSKVETPSDTSANKLNAFINAVPTKRFQETAELGLNYSERVPGPFTSLRLRARNVFGGAENLDFGLRGGYEGQVSLDSRQTVIIRELGADVALSFPTFLLPFGGGKVLSDNNPRTRIYAGYTDVDRDEYHRTNYDLVYSYIWQKSRTPAQPPYLQYIFSPINLQIARVDTAGKNFQRFREYLERFSQGSRSLIESFRPAFISTISFNATYNTNDFTQTRDARLFRLQLEVGGLSQRLGFNPKLGGLNTFQFVKVNPDYRRYIPLGGKRFFVYRLNMGVGNPLFKTELLPYDKYFFAGGGSSVRAWLVRRLGPGSYATTSIDTVNGAPVVVRDFTPEQPGEVLIEGSMEYRFNMFSFLNGAVFVDAGNVWFLRENPERPGADFALDRFYKEFAVGTGFGLRFDLSVLILRFDFATKVYDPAALDGNNFIISNFRFWDFFSRNNQSNLTIGIGYPF
ncbi:translocation and assembly module lipoprotein TamL [Pontibacter beigongshangensis]